MKANEIPNLNLYWGQTIECGFGKPLRICSFLPKAAAEHHMRLRQHDGIIDQFYFQVVPSDCHKNIELDSQWLFLQDNHTLTSIENLYISYLAGIL